MTLARAEAALFYSLHLATLSIVSILSSYCSSLLSAKQNPLEIPGTRQFWQVRCARGLFPAQLTHYFVQVSGESVFAVAPAFTNVDTLDERSLCSRLQYHGLPFFEEPKQIIVGAPEF